MDIHALRQWLIVIDNLMKNDKTSFKELLGLFVFFSKTYFLARITTSTSTTFSTLITSKEQEYEMRAQYLKRLAFVILSSELDQYSGQLNEIQGDIQNQIWKFLKIFRKINRKFETVSSSGNSHPSV